jgi:hypothetical protein
MWRYEKIQSKTCSEKMSLSMLGGKRGEQKRKKGK